MASRSGLSYREKTATEMNVLTAAICFAGRYDQLNIAALARANAGVYEQRACGAGGFRLPMVHEGRQTGADVEDVPTVFFLCDGDVFLLLFSSLILTQRPAGREIRA